MKYIDADKLKGEIERRRLHFNKEAEKYQALNNGYSQNCYGARDALRDLENFLSTLESEKPIPKDLEEAAEEYEKKHTYQRYDGGGLTPEYDATLAEAVIFGAKWQKEQDEKELSEKIAAAYQLGLADKEKQMMAGAVVGVFLNNPYPTICLDDCVDYDFKDNQEIRFIIVKED